MKKNLIPILFIAVFFSSCKQIFLWKYGVKAPRIETQSSILNYAKKQGQNPENIFLFRDSLAYNSFIKDTVFNKAFLSAIVFDKHGSIVDYKDPKSCQWSAVGYIEKLKRDTTYSVDTTHNFFSVLPSLVHLNGQSMVNGNPQDYDYIVLFTWAKFIGKINERLFAINEAAKNNPNASIRVISLNVDMLDSWGLKEVPEFMRVN
jgi:hypothetical protein